MKREGAPNSETDHAKVDHDDSFAGHGRRLRGDCENGWLAKPRRTSIDEFGQQLLPGDAPVGHRQPRTDQAPAEKDPVEDPNDPINRENAQLDRMTKGICRGC